MLVWQMMRNDERGGWQGLLAMKRGEMGGRLHAVGCDDGAALRLVLKKPSNHTHHPPSPALLLKKKPPVCSYNTHHSSALLPDIGQGQKTPNFNDEMATNRYYAKNVIHCNLHTFLGSLFID